MCYLDLAFVHFPEKYPCVLFNVCVVILDKCSCFGIRHHIEIIEVLHPKLVAVAKESNELVDVVSNNVFSMLLAGACNTQYLSDFIRSISSTSNNVFIAKNNV